MTKLIQFILENVERKGKYNDFVAAVNNKLPEDSGGILVFDLTTMGIYERNLKYLLIIQKSFPDKWRNIICEALVEIVPEKKEEIEKMSIDNQGAPIREGNTEKEGKQAFSGIFQKLKNVIGGIIQNGNDNKAEITVNVLPSEIDTMREEEEANKKGPMISGGKDKCDINRNKTDTDSEKAQEVIFKSALMSPTEIKEKKDKYRERGVLDMEALEKIITVDRKMFDIFDIVEKVAQTDCSVLILGETGTGKQLIAELLHYSSARRNARFGQLNCGAFNESLIDSELFGHEKGSFTGAISKKIGRLVDANGGTIFLDEIGNMPKSIQAKLLKTLEDFKVIPIGSLESIPIDVRIVCATNKDLSTNDFMQDLLYRINKFTITIPPLRERNSDIKILSNEFVERFNKKNSRQIKMGLSVLDEMKRQPFYGNIRELETQVLNYCVLGKNDTLPLSFEQISGSIDITEEKEIEALLKEVLLNGSSIQGAIRDAYELAKKRNCRTGKRDYKTFARRLKNKFPNLHERLKRGSL